MFDLNDLLTSFPNPIFVVKPIEYKGYSEDFIYHYVNEAFCMFIGRDENELIGRRYLEAFPNGEDSWFNAFLETVKNKKVSYIEADSHVIGRHIFAELFPVGDDLCGCIIHNYEDISKKVRFIRNQERLRKNTNIDYLTGFYTRYYLPEYLELIKGQTGIGIVCLDLNDLKFTNEHFGYVAGDKRIKDFAKIIKKYYRNSTIFRVSGDEFIVICINKKVDEFIRISENLKRYLEKKALAAIGYSYYEQIDSIKYGIEQCDKLMKEHQLKTKIKYSQMVKL